MASYGGERVNGLGERVTTSVNQSCIADLYPFALMSERHHLDVKKITICI